MLIVDAHLDLAYNALRGRDLTLPAIEQAPRYGEGSPSVGLPDLVAGGVGLVCGTIFCEPAGGDEPGYSTAEEARKTARRQLQWYYKQAADGRLKIIASPAELEDLETEGKIKAPVPFLILLMEGADPFVGPEDVAEWFAGGLRIVGLAWKRTRMAGGTGEPGGLTELGRAVVKEMDRHGMIHDASHLAEQAFWDLMDVSAGPVIASHSNCRSIVPTDRQLTDEMIRAIAARGGVIGINFFDKFLLSPAEQGRRRATLADVVRQARHICDVLGDAKHVGLGTDMDGGFGGEKLPEEIRTSADLPRVAEALGASGFSDADVSGIMGGNWRAYFARNLPA